MGWLVASSVASSSTSRIPSITPIGFEGLDMRFAGTLQVAGRRFVRDGLNRRSVAVSFVGASSHSLASVAK